MSAKKAAKTRRMQPLMTVAPALPCSADFVMPFGKYRGQTLDQISDNDLGYVMWLADKNVLKIERTFLNDVRIDKMEAESELWYIINEHVHDIY